ncbi:MAG TPA: GMC family oxidoreductase [Thermoleophilaceae bacterium]|nr:GMC family oxidoreductase [Thermoleophilaceae bacterium]
MQEERRALLRAVCDTVYPRIERDSDPDGFFARSASDLGLPDAVEDLIEQIPDETIRGGLEQLLDVLGQQGFLRMPSQDSREQLLRNLALASADAAAGVSALAGMTLFLAYGAPDPESGQNPNWRTFGYPGPAGPPPQVPKPLEVRAPADGATIEADVCVVGSGSGGGVIAATLAKQGKHVVVLEASGYFNESDFAQLELKAYQEMFWRGGPTPSADGNISMQAGTTLGGGTTINWTNCLRTTDWVRSDWANDHGLEGLDGSDYDRHLDSVLARIGATDKCSDLNGPQQRMKEAADALDWSFKTIVRNANPEKYSPDSAGHLGFGDQSGAKNSGDRTWLRDAFENGADLYVRSRAQRVLTENGRATGVEALHIDAEGNVVGSFTVRTPTVVVACGSLESPALLLRSGIGGPAVGNYLRLHPCVALVGSYAEDQRAWWGAPQSGLVDEFANVEDGYGFLIESVQYAPGLIGSAIPWVSAETHKDLVARAKYNATFVPLPRDRGHGRVEVDGSGEAVVWYSVEDEQDRRTIHLGIDKVAEAHRAGGAVEIAALATGLPSWRRGDDLGRFTERVKRIPLGRGGWRLFTAHQMGTCRMGADPQTSVAGPFGELHDTKGVWIGDASAFPTASGTNPMVTVMALAHRTAEAIAGTTEETHGSRDAEPAAHA